MKIITWNVNGIRAAERKGELHNLIEREAPDLLLLQEIKGNRDQFSQFLTDNPGYHQYYHSAEKKGYAGTGLWIKKDFFDGLTDFQFLTSIPGAPNADEGRISHAQFSLDDEIYDVFSIYFPNGGKNPKAWEEKLEFYERTLDYMNDLRSKGHIVIIGGDMNVAHNEVDIARPKANDGKIGFHPKERNWMDRVMQADWADAWRAKNPDAIDVYSWWTMRGGARERNVGWRIDYFLLEKNNLDRVLAIEYQHDQMGSDHCPLKLIFS
jgi:exodeoxyribonuclease-3